MRQLLIIYPHWPPSNLAGVHRARLVANYTARHGWKSVVLAVHPEYYEETPDHDLLRTVSEDVEVIHVKAYPVPPIRFIGDIGIRSFPFLYRKALELIRNRQVDFVWIPIPSFYTALLGRMLRKKTGIPYGIDYIDPWVRDISGRADWRHRLTNFLAWFLEPIAVKKAALITGVSYDYYQPVLKRNFSGYQWVDPNIHDSAEESIDLNVGMSEGPTRQPKHKRRLSVFHTSFPYGFDSEDHHIKLDHLEFPWKAGIKPWIYAGAFLPNSRLFVELLFKKISSLRDQHKWPSDIELVFVGTGNYPGKTIRDYAEEYGLGSIVKENRQRYPFLEVLNFLSEADTVMVIGSTEKHYTASKIYQSLLSKRPVWSIFHEESTALQVLSECKAQQYTVKYKAELSKEEVEHQIEETLLSRIASDTWEPDYSKLEKYSSAENTRKLLTAIEASINISHSRH